MLVSHTLSTMASCARTAYAALWAGQPKVKTSASTRAQTLANHCRLFALLGISDFNFAHHRAREVSAVLPLNNPALIYLSRNSSTLFFSLAGSRVGDRVPFRHNVFAPSPLASLVVRDENVSVETATDNCLLATAFHSFGSTIPFCPWYLPFLSL